MNEPLNCYILIILFSCFTVSQSFTPNFIANPHSFPHEGGFSSHPKSIGNELELINPKNIQFYSAQPNSVSSSFTCDPYSATDTSSAVKNYAVCTIPNVCPGDSLRISDCADTCVGDQQYKLYDGGTIVGIGNRGCTYPTTNCVSGEYSYTGSTCTNLTLHEGCYSSGSCSGVFTVEYTNGTVGDTYTILDVTPTVIENDGIVSVTYYSSYPKSTDWIAAYAPLPANIADLANTVPFKYGYCDADPKYLTSGVGTLQFNLTNLRSSIGFVYYISSLSYPVYVNHSNINVTFANIDEPLKPRVVATGDPNVLKLLWSSATSMSPALYWGTQSTKQMANDRLRVDQLSDYPNKMHGNTSRIDESQLCDTPADGVGWRDLGLIHTANFTGVMQFANQDIYYVFGDEDTNNYSDEFKLHIPPNPGTQPDTRPTTVVLFDDLGRGSTDMTYTYSEYGRPSIFTTMAVGALVENGSIDAIYHGGDLSYANGYMSVWDFWLDMVSPMSSGVIYLTTVGNHEADTPNTSSLSTYTTDGSGGECSIPALKLMPQPGNATVDEPWWSYDVGIIHFVGMSTEHNFTVGSKQYKWIEQDLMNVNRTLFPWIIFGGHRAMYLNSNYCGTQNADGSCEADSDIAVMDNLILNIEPLLWKYRVNFAFWGHNHVVQRQAAVLNKTVIQHSVAIPDGDDLGTVTHYQFNPQATVHVMVGTGGAGFTKNAVTPWPDWNELTFYEWGYSIATAVNESYLDWIWINSQTNNIVDHMVITQDDATKPWVLPESNDDVASVNSDELKDNTTFTIVITVVSSIVLFVLILLTTFYWFGEKPIRYSPISERTQSLLHSSEHEEKTNNEMTNVLDI